MLKWTVDYHGSPKLWNGGETAMSNVALVRCESYEYEEVKAATRRGIDLLGGAGGFIKKFRRGKAASFNGGVDIFFSQGLQ